MNRVMLGAGIAVSALEAGIVSGSLPQLLASGDIDRRGVGTAVYNNVVKPLYWINFFGLVPAIVLGAWFGVARRLDELRRDP